MIPCAGYNDADAVLPSENLVQVALGDVNPALGFQNVQHGLAVKSLTTQKRTFVFASGFKTHFNESGVFFPPS